MKLVLTFKLKKIIQQMYILIFATHIFNFGCAEFKSQKNIKRYPNARSIVYYNENPFKQSQIFVTKYQQALSELKITDGSSLARLNSDILWAIANLDNYKNNFSGKYFSLLLQTRGVVPQALVPQVRQEIQNNPILKFLMSTDSNGIANFGSWLMNLFMNDNTVAKKIRSSISDKISRSLNTVEKIENFIPFRFDLYQLPFNDFSSNNKTHPSIFDLSDQASKWALVFSLDNMWTSSQSGMYQPIAFNSHGLQLLITVLSIAEWSYLWGLEKDSTGRIYGGLSFYPADNNSGILTAFDPRVDDISSPKVVAGKYEISYPSVKGDIDLAIKVKETWSRVSADINLDEQSRLLASAALAYSHLKPSARNSFTARFFDKNVGILPDEVYQLPLIFLISTGSLLNKYYIDQNNLVINQYVIVTRSFSNDSKIQSASLKSLARLAKALSLWVDQLQNVTNDRLPTDITQEIIKSLPKLKDALRFSIFDMFSRYIIIDPNSRLKDIAFSSSKYGGSKLKFSEVAEALAVMSDVFFNTLSTSASDSDYHYKLVGLLHYFAAEYLADTNLNLDAEDVIWGYIVLKNFKRYESKLLNAIWLEDALKNFETAIKNWAQSL